MTFAALAAALVVWEHGLMVHTETTEDMAPMLRSAEPRRDAAESTFSSGAAVVIGRRPWLVHMLVAAGTTIGVALLFPLRSLTPKIGDKLEQTAWARGVRLVRSDGSIVKASDLAVNSVTTVFPEGHTGATHTSEMANAATVLVRVPPEELELPAGRAAWAPQGLVAYSKVCTHAGCPVALYRAAARQLFCPCHQSTFDVLRGGTPIFGPAERALPQLPIHIADDGSIQAMSDFPRTHRSGLLGSGMITKKAIGYLDDRLGSANFMTRAMRKVFPDHWSFMLGEICVYAFFVLLATGTYIAFFFNDSDTAVAYHGSYAPLAGRVMPHSYISVLHLSFDVRLGLLIRQMHHWAALVFIGAIVFHMARVFFTGAFRKPREMNWVAGMTLFLLAIADGFTGYSLPGDAMSGAGLRIAYSVAESIPIVGEWIAFGYFGGTYPTDVMTSRLFITHVLFVPLAIIGVMSLHLGMVWRQHHTQFAGPGRTERKLVGSALWPYYAMKSIGLLSATVAVLAFLGGFFTINPIWIYGPYDPWTAASPAQPDWYVAWLDGALRLGPPWAIHLFGHTIPPLFWSAILMPGILFTGLFTWPFVEARITRDAQPHNIDDMPYDKPWRLGLGIAVITFGTVLGFAASDDVQAKLLHFRVEQLMYLYRVCAILLPFVFGFIAVAIGFELRARLHTPEGQRQMRRATLKRNEQGGFVDEPLETNT